MFVYSIFYIIETNTGFKCQIKINCTWVYSKMDQTYEGYKTKNILISKKSPTIFNENKNQIS